MRPSLRSVWMTLAVLGAFVPVSRLLSQPSPAPALALRSELTWSPVNAGDPLRIRVFLSSPRVFEESLEWVRQIEQGPAPVGEIPAPSVQLPAAWERTVRLRLVRLKSDGTRETVLEPAAWDPWLRPQVGLPPGVPQAGSVRSREWLVPEDSASLTPGNYVLEAWWEGRELVPAEQLPASGVLSAEAVSFEVAPANPALAGPGDPNPLAEHLGRRAFAAYVRGDYAAARRLGIEAVERDPENQRPNRIETRLLVARSALALRDYAGTIASLEALERHPGAANLGEVLEVARAQVVALAPRLRLFAAMPAAGWVRLELTSVPGQRYVTYGSDDLRAWLPFATNVATTNWITLPDLPAPEGRPRFYRAELRP